jgi:hypothetical protein
MRTASNSLVTVYASNRLRKPSPPDPMQPVMQRSPPTSGRSATRPTSIGTAGRLRSEQVADINRNARPTSSECAAYRFWRSTIYMRQIYVMIFEECVSPARHPPVSNDKSCDMHGIGLGSYWDFLVFRED